MKRYIIRLWIACSLMGSFAACEYSEADAIPSASAPGWQVFDYVDPYIRRSMDMVRTMYCFNEYYKQTTVEGRVQMQKLYFPRQQILGEACCWTITDVDGSVWQIETPYGESLDDMGQWRMLYMKNPNDDEAEVSRMIISTVGVSRCQCTISLVSGGFREQARWWIRAEHDELLLRTLFIEGTGTQIWGGLPSSGVGCETLSPLIFDVQTSDFVTGIFRAELFIPESLEIEAIAEYVAGGRAKVTYNGVTELR